jgi:hypothetical protein
MITTKPKYKKRTYLNLSHLKVVRCAVNAMRSWKNDGGPMEN